MNEIMLASSLLATTVATLFGYVSSTASLTSMKLSIRHAVYSLIGRDTPASRRLASRATKGWTAVEQLVLYST